MKTFRACFPPNATPSLAPSPNEEWTKQSRTSSIPAELKGISCCLVFYLQTQNLKLKITIKKYRKPYSNWLTDWKSAIESQILAAVRHKIQGAVRLRETTPRTDFWPASHSQLYCTEFCAWMHDTSHPAMHCNKRPAHSIQSVRAFI